MEISSNINSIQTNMNNFNNNVEKLSQGADVSESVSRLLTDNISLENGIDAQINSIKTQEEVMGTLLDIIG